MTKSVVIENVDDRLWVRSMYKNAHCRRMMVRNRDGFYVFFADANTHADVILGFDAVNRANAWSDAAKTIRDSMVQKLES